MLDLDLKPSETVTTEKNNNNKNKNIDTILYKLDVDKRKRGHKKQLLGKHDRVVYINKRKKWYENPENKKKHHDYYHFKYKNKRRLMSMSRRYWLFWPMMYWFLNLPDVSISHQPIYKKLYNKNYYKNNRLKIKIKNFIAC